MEPTDSDVDPSSDYDGSMSTSEFTSVTTSRLRHSFEHGRYVTKSDHAAYGFTLAHALANRRYQGFLQGRYGLPNDDIEQEREGMKHKLYVDYLLEGQLVLAPIGDYPQKIVDLGTGVGFWAQDGS